MKKTKLKWIYRDSIHHYGYIDRAGILVVLFMIFTNQPKKKFRLSIYGQTIHFNKLKDAKKCALMIHKG